MVTETDMTVVDSVARALHEGLDALSDASDPHARNLYDFLGDGMSITVRISLDGDNPDLTVEEIGVVKKV